ncbi:MAGUK p55 subfamily member 7 [Lingula anatina]|uniref:MAGUK p55 subfamily member 7 n=1 Tax=Lingula anatina TaxID=7574 RepID=A0A1S3JV94_LINAN|nr:MAGUK p55 subfamily member 7 [Lingula anatina]|eukprot:XP_013414263.1 MAGUK p55 subfamily member 7 [Lingula anatina]
MQGQMGEATIREFEESSIRREDPGHVGRFKTKINKSLTVFQVATKINNLLPGGAWKPKNCFSRTRLAVIIPYRDREFHLTLLLSVLHPLLQRQMIDYRIFVIEQVPVRMRAHFNYDPFKDTLIPCREAGLPFKKGDILHIVDQTDLNWWQARREGDKNMRAGLIPGKQLQERKEAMRRTVGTLDGGLYRERENKGIRSSTMNGSLDSRKARKTKKIMYQSENSSDFDNAEIITYEEVEKYYPESGRYRPIVLIGPPGAGRNELKRRLITSNPEHFSATIPHTSRSKKPSEVDGKEYYFVSRTEMDRRIAERRFVEYGEYKGNLYGTSIESITSALNAGKVCVLTPHPQALKMLRSAELKPYVIFIKPPSIERLRDTRLVPTTKGNTDNGMIQKTFSDEELHEMILNASKIEENYSHFFDKTIVNDELTTVFTELCAAVYRIEHEPQWVPISWVR